MTPKTATLQRIRITPEMKGKLERLALEDKRTVSDYVRLVLEQHLKSVECLQDLASDEATIKVSGLNYTSGDVVVTNLEGKEYIKVIK